MDFNKIVEQVIFEAAREDVKQRLIKKYMDAKPGTRLPERHFSDVIDHVHDNLLPDANKSQADLEWMSDRHIAGDRNLFFSNNGEIKHKLTEFNKPSIKEKMPKKKLNQYKSWDEFDTAITPHIGAAPTVKEKADRDTKVLFKNDTHIVRQHMSQESIMNASKLHPENPNSSRCSGKATWCIAADSDTGRSYFNSYTENGKHPVYTIEHTGLHPTDPHRKYAIVADPARSRNGFKSIEFRDEPQVDDNWHDKYVLSNANKSIENTEPMQYVNKAIGYKGNGKFEIHHSYGEREEYTKNEEGKYHGEKKLFDSKGTLIRHSHFKDGLEEGITTKLEDGWKTISHFKDGERHGEEKTYSPEGTLTDHIHYKEGKRHGLYMKYDSLSGKVKSSTNYEDGHQHGESISYSSYEDKTVSQYHHGILRDQKIYDREGTLRIHKSKDDPDKFEGNSTVKHYIGNNLVYSGKENHFGRVIGVSSSYDEKGNLSHTIDNDPEDTSLDKTATHYVSGTNKIKYIAKYKKNGHYERTEYHEESQTPKVTRLYDNQDNRISNVHYNESGKKTLEENFFGNDNLSSTTHFHENTGEQKEFNTFNLDGTPMTTKRYNERGELTYVKEH